MALTPEQQTEAEHFAAERIAAQFSTEPVDENEAEAWLREAYQVAGLAPPSTIFWLDGPLDLVDLFVPSSAEAMGDARGWLHLIAGVGENVGEHLWETAWSAAGADVEFRLKTSVRGAVEHKMRESVEVNVGRLVRASVTAYVDEKVWARVRTSTRPRVKAGLWEDIKAIVDYSIKASTRAYAVTPAFAVFRFFDTYLSPNAAQALARFNEVVSGYWLGKELALIVRRPTVLSRDADGRLHRATGLCLAYPSGWGIYAWHGVQVPEKLIKEPDQLTRDDFLNAPNLEVRRVIQERMGSRFVNELNGYIIDEGSRGTLYQVLVPRDPEHVAHYLQVQDASTSRQYFLRVPPGITTAADAVAWSFGLSLEEYQPARET